MTMMSGGIFSLFFCTVPYVRISTFLDQSSSRLLLTAGVGAAQTTRTVNNLWEKRAKRNSSTGDSWQPSADIIPFSGILSTRLGAYLQRAQVPT